MTEKDKELPEDTQQSPGLESRPLQLSGTDGRLRSKLPPGYTKPSMYVDDVGRSCVLSCRLPAYFCGLVADDNYEYVASFLRASLIRDSHRANVSLSKQSVLFLRDMVLVYGAAAAVN